MNEAAGNEHHLLPGRLIFSWPGGPVLFLFFQKWRHDRWSNLHRFFFKRKSLLMGTRRKRFRVLPFAAIPLELIESLWRRGYLQIYFIPFYLQPNWNGIQHSTMFSARSFNAIAPQRNVHPPARWPTSQRTLNDELNLTLSCPLT